LPALRAAGVACTINTDDPSISNTTLTDEYLVALRGIGIPLRAVRQMILAAAGERAAALVLEAPFTSIADMARVAYPILGPFLPFVRARTQRSRRRSPGFSSCSPDPVASAAMLFSASRPKTFVPRTRYGRLSGGEDAERLEADQWGR
jgi:hypothetical protein